MRFGHRASHVARAASADQIAFGLYLPGAEMMLAASLHSVHEGERQMLFQRLDRLSGGDLLLMDRGYPSRGLVCALNARGVGFCMRLEKAGNAGFSCVREFLRWNDDERDRHAGGPRPPRRCRLRMPGDGANGTPGAPYRQHRQSACE